MGHLVEDHLGTGEALVLGGRVAEDQPLRVCDRGDVLHRSGVEFRDEDLVVFPEWVEVVEALDEEVETLASDLEDLLLVEMAHERAPAVERQRDARVLGADRVVGAGDEREEVGCDRRRRLEAHELALVGDVVAVFRRPVRDQRPRRWSRDRERESRLQVRLVEAR